MNDFVKRFINFDKLIATTLIKILYWVGLAGIAVWGVIFLVSAFGMMTQNVLAGLGMLVLLPLALVIMVLFWRFLCEVYIVIFGIYDRLGEVRDRMGGPVTPPPSSAVPPQA
jgi:hypothetical protein